MAQKLRTGPRRGHDESIQAGRESGLKLQNAEKIQVTDDQGTNLVFTLALHVVRRLNTWINSLNRRATLAILRVNRTELVFSRPLFHR